MTDETVDRDAVDRKRSGPEAGPLGQDSDENLVVERGGPGEMFSAQRGGGIVEDRRGPSIGVEDSDLEALREQDRDLTEGGSGSEQGGSETRDQLGGGAGDASQNENEPLVPGGAFGRTPRLSAKGPTAGMDSGRGEEASVFGSEEGTDSVRAGDQMGGWSTGLGGTLQGGERTGRTTTGGETTTMSDD